MLLLGYFEGLDSERAAIWRAAIWRAADSLSLRGFVDVAPRSLAAPPDGVAHQGRVGALVAALVFTLNGFWRLVTRFRAAISPESPRNTTPAYPSSSHQGQ